jgi:hypothetical protein
MLGWIEARVLALVLKDLKDVVELIEAFTRGEVEALATLIDANICIICVYQCGRSGYIDKCMSSCGGGKRKYIIAIWQNS